MKAVYQAIILLGLFKLLSSIELTTINNTICVDCSKDKQVKCIIEDTGFECFNEHSMKIIKGKSLKPKPPSTENLDVCIPKDLKILCIDGMPIFCCISFFEYTISNAFSVPI